MFRLCQGRSTGPSKSGRKYEPLTQGNGLNPNHDLSSTERDVPNDFCVLRNKSLSRKRKQPTLFRLFVQTWPKKKWRGASLTTIVARQVLPVTMLLAPFLQVCPRWNLPSRASVASGGDNTFEVLFIDPITREVFPFPRAGDQSEIHGLQPACLLARQLSEFLSLRVASLCVQRNDRTSDHCQRIAMHTTDTLCPCSFRASTPCKFFHSNSLHVFQDQLCCSNSADGIVAGLFSSLLLLDLRCQYHEKTSFSRGRKMCARDFPGHRQKATAGKPSRQALWLRAICADVRAQRTLPDGVTAAVPDAWSPGDSLASTGVSDAEVGAAGSTCPWELRFA